MITRIVTRYSGPTDTRGSRIVVRVFDSELKTRQRSYSFNYGAYCAHEFAAAEFANELGVKLPDIRDYNETGYVYKF